MQCRGALSGLVLADGQTQLAGGIGCLPAGHPLLEIPADNDIGRQGYSGSQPHRRQAAQKPTHTNHLRGTVVKGCCKQCMTELMKHMRRVPGIRRRLVPAVISTAAGPPA